MVRTPAYTYTHEYTNTVFRLQPQPQVREPPTFSSHYICNITESCKPLKMSLGVKGGRVFHLNGKIVTIMVLPQHVQWAHCATYNSPGCWWIWGLARGERDGVEVQSEPTAESPALFADIFWDFDHTVEMAAAQSCLALLVVLAAHCQTHVKACFILLWILWTSYQFSKTIWI